MAVAVREQGVCALLVAQDLGAGLEAAMATQAGKHGEVGERARGASGRRRLIGRPPVVVLPLRPAGRPGLQLRCGAARLSGVW